MNLGMVALIVFSAWALVSIVASLFVGGMAKDRDGVLEGPRAPASRLSHARQHPVRRAS